MNSRTQEMTFGAMLIAVFGVLLVLNRQTGGLFEEMFFFILPLPMTVFSMKYGIKDSITVYACMILLSVFLGTLYTLFYVVTEALLGVILGTCLRKKVDLNHIQILVIFLSAVFSVLGSVVLISLFGVSLNAELEEMQNMITNAFLRSGFDQSVIEQVLSYASLKRLYILSMVLLGIIQGFVIFRLSLVILKKLRLNVPQPQPVGLYYPPVWSGYAALFLFSLYIYSMSHPFGNDTVQNIAQTAGLCGYLYLVCFGWIAFSMLIKQLIPGAGGRLIAIIGGLFLLLAMPFIFLVFGFLYIIPDFHSYLLRGFRSRNEASKPRDKGSEKSTRL